MYTHPSRDPRSDPRAAAADALGPYEARYDVRRGYDEEPSAAGPAAAHRAAPEPVWVGKRRER